jgi:hypothetical protein
MQVEVAEGHNQVEAVEVDHKGLEGDHSHRLLKGLEGSCSLQEEEGYSRHLRVEEDYSRRLRDGECRNKVHLEDMVRLGEEFKDRVRLAEEESSK